MSWFLVDDSFAGHPKVVRLLALPHGLSAIGLWTLCGSWARRYRTSGFVSAEFADASARASAQNADASALVSALVSADMWSAVDGGYQFNDWDEVYKSERKSSERKDKDAERKRLKRASEAARTETRTSGGRGADAARTETRTKPRTLDLSPSPSPDPNSEPPNPLGDWADSVEPDPEPLTPGLFRFELEELVRTEFMLRGATAQKAADRQWLGGCLTVRDALGMGLYPDARAAMEAFAKRLVDACAGGEKLGFALQQVQLGEQLKPVAPGGRQLSALALATLERSRRAEGT